MIPYIELEVQLHDCVSDPEAFMKELKDYLIEKLKPKYADDISISLIRSAGWPEGKDKELSI